MLATASVLLTALVSVLAQETTTTEVQRIVGEPLPTWVVIGSGVALGVVILVAGFVAQRRMSRSP